MPKNQNTSPSWLVPNGPANLLYKGGKALSQYIKTKEQRHAAQLAKEVAKLEADVAAMEKINILKQKKQELREKMENYA